MAFYSNIDSTKQFRLGTVKTDVAGNKYVYLQGVASNAAGKWVIYDEAFVTTLLAANAVGPVGISMSANTSTTNYSWFQIYGVNTIASSDTTAADKALFIDGTSGRVDDAVVTGDLVLGAYSMTADTANVLTVQINYPSVTDVLG